MDRSPLTFVDRPLFNPCLGYATYIVPGVLILILQQTMLIGIGMISGTRAERADLYLLLAWICTSSRKFK